MTILIRSVELRSPFFSPFFFPRDFNLISTSAKDMYRREPMYVYLSAVGTSRKSQSSARYAQVKPWGGPLSGKRH